MPVNDAAVSGQQQKSNHAFQIDDGVMFTQGILEGLTGVVSETSSGMRFLVTANDWPTGVCVMVSGGALKKLGSNSKLSRREAF